DALRDAAVELAGDDHRIDDGAEVVDAGIAHDLDHAGIGIDLDFGDVTAVREGRGRVGCVVVDVERRGHALRHLFVTHPARQLHDVYAAVGAGDGEAAVGEFDIGLGGFHHMRGRLLAL